MESGLYDVSGYDALQLRVRGDGRRFIANLSAPSMGRRDDVWQTFVFTRGGPEWEDITVRTTHSICLFFSFFATCVDKNVCFSVAVFRVFPDKSWLHARRSDTSAQVVHQYSGPTAG